MKHTLTIVLSFLISALIIGVLFFRLPSKNIGERIEFQTQDSTFSFTYMPSKGRDLDMMNRQFSSFKASNTDAGDLVLYRTTRKNYLKIGKWANYKLEPAWQYPYKALN